MVYITCDNCIHDHNKCTNKKSPYYSTNKQSNEGCRYKCIKKYIRSSMKYSIVENKKEEEHE